MARSYTFLREDSELSELREEERQRIELYTAREEAELQEWFEMQEEGGSE